MPEIGSTLDITTTSRGWLLVGELDAHTAGQLAEVLVELPERSVEVDVGGVTFMDSSGLRVLVDAAERTRERGRGLIVANAPPSVRRLVEISGLQSHLDLG